MSTSSSPPPSPYVLYLHADHRWPYSLCPLITTTDIRLGHNTNIHNNYTLYTVCTHNICGQWRGRIVLFRRKRQASQLYVCVRMWVPIIIGVILCCSGVSRAMVRPFAGSFISSWMTQAGGLDRGGVVRIACILLLLLLSCVYRYIVIAYPRDVYAARDPYAAARPKRTFEFRFQRARTGQKTETGVRPVRT